MAKLNILNQITLRHSSRVCSALEVIRKVIRHSCRSSENRAIRYTLVQNPHRRKSIVSETVLHLYDIIMLRMSRLFCLLTVLTVSEKWTMFL